MVGTLFSLLRAQVQSLVRKLISCKKDMQSGKKKEKKLTLNMKTQCIKNKRTKKYTMPTLIKRKLGWLHQYQSTFQSIKYY